MTAIIYLNNKPFYVFETDKTEQEFISIPGLMVEAKIRLLKNDILYLHCVSCGEVSEKTDIVYHPSYKKTGDNVEPVWFENDQGKQLTFFIPGNKSPVDYIRKNFPCIIADYAGPTK